MNFGPLMAEICWRVWGTPANFNRLRVLAALLHGTLVTVVRQTLQHLTEVPPIFSRVAITLDINPHSSFLCFPIPEFWTSARVGNDTLIANILVIFLLFCISIWYVSIFIVCCVDGNCQNPSDHWCESWNGKTVAPWLYSHNKQLRFGIRVSQGRQSAGKRLPLCHSICKVVRCYTYSLLTKQR